MHSRITCSIVCSTKGDIIAVFSIIIFLHDDHRGASHSTTFGHGKKSDDRMTFVVLDIETLPPTKEAQKDSYSDKIVMRRSALSSRQIPKSVFNSQTRAL